MLLLPSTASLRRPDRVAALQVTDEQALAAAVRLADDERLLVEVRVVATLPSSRRVEPPWQPSTAATWRRWRGGWRRGPWWWWSVGATSSPPRWWRGGGGKNEKQ